MNISEAAKASGLQPKTIRFYDSIGLVVPHRLDNGYRNYTDAHVTKLRIVRSVRNLGLPLEKCRILIALYESDTCSCSEMTKYVSECLSEIDDRIGDLKENRESLVRLIDGCSNSRHSRCSIMDQFENGLTTYSQEPIKIYK